MHVESDIVVYQENGTRAVVASIPYVCQNTIKGVGVEVSPPHFNNRAEAAVVGAATRRFNYIHLSA